MDIFSIILKNNIHKALRIIPMPSDMYIQIYVTNTCYRRQLYRYECIYECGDMRTSYFGDLSRSLTESRKIDTVGHDAQNGIYIYIYERLKIKQKKKPKHTRQHIYNTRWLSRYYEEQRTVESGGYI